MIFTGQTPLTQYYSAPDYVDNPSDIKKLALAGYKPTGEQNTWGKISSWLPMGVPLNALAKKAALGSEDAVANIKQDFDNRLYKTAIGVGVVTGVVGGVTQNPELIKQGLNLTTQFGGQLAFDQNELITEGQAIYR